MTRLSKNDEDENQEGVVFVSARSGAERRKLMLFVQPGYFISFATMRKTIVKPDSLYMQMIGH